MCTISTYIMKQLYLVGLGLVFSLVESGLATKPLAFAQSEQDDQVSENYFEAIRTSQLAKYLQARANEPPTREQSKPNKPTWWERPLEELNKKKDNR